MDGDRDEGVGKERAAAMTEVREGGLNVWI